MRSRFEPLIEMMQIKGNSEVHRRFWAADEFANFENADSLGDYSGRDLKKFGKQNFVRWGVTKGLAYEKSLGVQSLSLRLRRRHRQPQRHALERRRGQLRSAATVRPTARSSGGATGEVGGWLKGKDLEPRLAHRRLGAPEHPRGDLGRR